MRRLCLNPALAALATVFCLGLLAFSLAANAAANEPDEVTDIDVQLVTSKTKGNNYEWVLLFVNNSKQSLTSVDSMLMAVKYDDGEVKRVKFEDLRFSSPIPPSDARTYTLNFKPKSFTVDTFKTTITKATFTPYSPPAWDRPPGSKSGSVVWTYIGTEDREGKLIVKGTLLNNTNEDIVSLNPSTQTVNHAEGTMMRRTGRLTFNSPLKAYSQTTVLFPVPYFKGVHNAQLTDITYLSRPASVGQQQAASQKTSGPAHSSPSSRWTNTTVSWDERRQSWVITAMLINDSSTHRIARLDNITVRYSCQAGKNSASVPALSISVPPLGSQRVTLYLDGKGQAGSWYFKPDNIKITYTPRFLAPEEKSGDTTIIINKR